MISSGVSSVVAGVRGSGPVVRIRGSSPTTPMLNSHHRPVLAHLLDDLLVTPHLPGALGIPHVPVVTHLVRYYSDESLPGRGDRSRFWSRKARSLQPSPIRVLNARALAKPELVNLAGGLPNPAAFPVQHIQVQVAGPGGSDESTTVSITPEDLGVSMQYGFSEGSLRLRSQMLSILKAEHGDVARSDSFAIGVTGGAQEAIGKALDMFVNPEDTLLVEAPTYSGALAYMLGHGCKLQGVPTDSNGMDVDALREILSTWDTESRGQRPHVVYTIPTGSNPTGAVMPEERRKELYQVAQEFDLLIIEDDPYYWLQFAPKRVPSIMSMDTDGRVIRLDSLSKICSSGLRVGAIMCHKELLEPVILLTQASNLHTSGISQAIASEVLSAWGVSGEEESLGKFGQHAAFVANMYRERLEIANSAATEELSDIARWGLPGAGMFLWIEVLGITDSADLVSRAVDDDILVVPGRFFMPNGEDSPYVRVSFSVASEANIRRGMKSLSKAIRA